MKSHNYASSGKKYYTPPQRLQNSDFQSNISENQWNISDLLLKNIRLLLMKFF